MKKVTVLMIVFVMMGTLFLSSCETQSKNSESTTTTTEATTTIPTIPNAVNFDVASLLTKEEVSDILGLAMSGPNVLERGEIAEYTTENASAALTVSIKEITREEYDAGLEEYNDLVDAPNLADSAKWSNEFKILMVFSDKYLLTFSIEKEGEKTEELLLLSRKLALKAVEKIK